MSSKKKRFAKGLGASALAVATLASGLSFGGAASAAGSDPAADYVPLVFTSHETREYVSVGRDPSKLTILERDAIWAFAPEAGRERGYVKKFSSEALAIEQSHKFTRLTSTWSTLKSSTGYCVGPHKSNFWISPWDCNSTDYDYRARLAADGTIEFNNFGNVAKLSYVTPNFGSPVALLNQKGLFAKPGGEYAQKRLTATGSFPTDATQRAQITGTAEAGATVVIKDGANDVARVTADATDGSYTWNVPAPMQGGTKSYTVSQIIDGTESGNVKVDLNYGTAVSITSPQDGANAEQGPVTITGRGENGSSVTANLNGTNLPATTVTNGTWTAQATLRLGENRITATQKSKGANTTTSTVTVNPGESSTIPFAVTTPTNNSTTNDPAVSFTGRATPGTKVSVVRGGQTVMAEVTADANGDWSGSGALVAGANAMTVRYTEPGEAQKTQQLTVTLTTGVTQPFTWGTPADGSTVSSRFSVSGTATTGTKVQLLRPTAGSPVAVTGVLDTDAQGNWSGTGTLAAGTHRVILNYMEPGKGKQSITRTITVNPGVTQPLSWDTPADGSTVSSTFSLTGKATTGTKVQLLRPTAGNPVAVTGVLDTDAQGNWSGTGTLAAGTHQLILNYLEPGKDKQSITRTITVNPGVTRPFDWATPGDGATIEGTFSLSGTATAGTKVQLLRPTAGNPVAVTGILTADANGNWSGTGTLAAGTHQLVMNYLEPGKGKQSINRTLTVQERTTVPFELTSPTNGDTVSSTFALTGKATTDTKVQLLRPTAGNPVAVTGILTADGKGNWSGTGTLAAGTHQLILNYLEPGKGKQSTPLTLTVEDRASVPFELTSPTSGDTVSSTFAVTGKATTGTKINLLRPNASGAAVAMDIVQADAQGNWSGIGTLPAGTHPLVLNYIEPGKGKVSINMTLTVN